MKPLFFTALLLLTNCTTEQATLTTPTQLFAQATDTSVSGLPPLSFGQGGKYKFKGPVSIVVQAGTSNVATPTVTDSHKMGKHAQGVNTGNGSPFTTIKQEVPWWVWLLIGGLSMAGWQWLKPFLRPKT